MTIIVATDGSEQSDGAIRAGALFGGKARPWRVVSAAPLIHNLAPELDLGITAEATEVLRDKQRQSVEQQMQRVLGEDACADVEIATGDPATVIATTAAREGASLIICGLGRHRLVDRLLGDETALAITRAAAQPVLAVPDDFQYLPRSAVVGVDFSNPSIQAARLSSRFTTASATIYLLHVAPRENVLGLVTSASGTYEERAAAELEQLIGRLDAPALVHFEAVVRHGDPASELLSFAAEAPAELIAVGTRGLGFVARLLLGSVATKVIRASPIPVLTIPSKDDAPPQP